MYALFEGERQIGNSFATEKEVWEAVIIELQRLVEPRHVKARFQEQTRAADGNTAEYVFELGWHRPEAAELPPLDILQLIERKFELKSFELTTDNGR